MVVTRLFRHAAHDYYTGLPLWDLEEWDYVAADRRPEPAEVPKDASYHHGYVGQDGAQHWVYVVQRPTYGTCRHCDRVVGRVALT